MTAIDSFIARLDAGDIILMDGGTEINRRGVPVDPNTWSGAAMLAHPDVIRDIHEDYLRAGADIIITNTFCTSRAQLEPAGMGDRTEEANKLAVRVAREAIKNAAPDREVIVAGSMSAFSASDLNSGLSYEVALAEFREQAQYLAEAGVDVIVPEMICRILDAKAAVQAASETGLPVWMGYSTLEHDGKPVLGLPGVVGNESIKEAVEAVEAMGVSMFYTMHSRPQDTALAFREMKKATGLPVGAYAHTIQGVRGPRTWRRPVGDEVYDNVQLDDDTPDQIIKHSLSNDSFLQYAREWADLGAQVIGGCCGTTPNHIRALKQGLPQKLPA